MDLIFFSSAGGYQNMVNVLPEFCAKYTGIAPVVNGKTRIYGGFRLKAVDANIEEI